MNFQSAKLDIKNNIKTLNKKDLIIFLIPVLIFGYYLYIFDPGILSYDSYNQLHQIATSNFNNWHPFFHTFIEMLCIKIYASPISVGILQILTFSVLWMIICKYHRKDEAIYGNWDKEFILQVIVTLVICLIPLNGIFAITLWKDILFSYFLMFLCFLIKVLLDKKGNVSYIFIICISMIMAFIAQLRPNGIYIILLVLIALAIYLFKNNRSEKFYIAIPALTVVFILLIASLNVVYEVEDFQRDALLAKTAHVLADYDLNLELNEADRNKIHELISEKDIKQSYNIKYSDSIFNHANATVFANNKATYLLMALSYSFKNPIHFLEYFFNSSPLVWQIQRGDDWMGTEFNTNIESGKQRFYTIRNIEPVANYDNASAKHVGTTKYNELNSFVNYVKDNKPLDGLLESPALCMYLSFLVMAGIYLLTRSKDILFVYLPNILNILIIMFSISAQDTRFLYANLLVFYLLVIMFINEYLKYKEKNDLNQTMNKIKQPSKNEQYNDEINQLLENKELMKKIEQYLNQDPKDK